MTSAMSGFARMRAIADAVLYEGYLLYPYRASSDKNRLRWQFGVLAPCTWSEATGLEAWWMQSEFAVEGGADVRIRGCARFLQPEARQLEVRRADGSRFEATPRLEVGGRLYQSFDEARLREVPFAISPLRDGGAGEVRLDTASALRVEPLPTAPGEPAARFVRESRPLAARLVWSAEHHAAPRPHWRVRVRCENDTPCAEPSAPRDSALRSALVGLHLLFEVEQGAFVSLAEPPDWARDTAAACENVRSWPVLAGAEGDRTLLLAAPIILSDHPEVAPESPGDLFDATEIDEILSLRTMTLTDAEKREARATDPRAAAIIDRCDHLSPELLDRLHGAVRSLRPVDAPAARAEPERLPPEPEVWEGWTDPTVPGEGSVMIAGVAVARGSRVRLAPSRRADAQDFMLRDRAALVAGVYEDLEGRTYLGVTLEDDPAADWMIGHGRYYYFFPDEVVPMTGDPA
jgi:hypothetical protein